jgi:hypothetical protein
MIESRWLAAFAALGCLALPACSSSEPTPSVAPEGGGEASGGTNSQSGGDSGGGGAGGGGAGTAGQAGAAGTVGLDPYRRCDQSLGDRDNPGCDANTRCVLGSCASPCDDDLSLALGTGAECPLPLTGTATRMCSILNCTLHCLPGTTCPQGMTCSATSEICLWP